MSNDPAPTLHAALDKIRDVSHRESAADRRLLAAAQAMLRQLDASCTDDDLDEKVIAELRSAVADKL